VHDRLFSAAALLLVGLALSPLGCSTGDENNNTTPGGPGCANGVKDGDEVGVDCGGACQKCAGDGCIVDGDCKSGKCEAGKCAAPAGKPCGVGVASGPCNENQPCETNDDCKTKKCEGAKCVVGAPGPTNGVKDNGETDVDCGGPNAPACPAGKACLTNDDCAEKYCPEDKKVCVTPTCTDGVQNGDESDVDCGGTKCPKCAVGKKCNLDGDCAGSPAGCNYKKLCVESASCKPQFGGDTCGAGNYEDPGKAHESCCRTLEVTGYADPKNPGKKVYLDKYEVTAGRMRAFIEAISAANGGQPNVRGWIQANTPAIWDPSWNQFMPTSNIEPADTAMPHYTLPSGVNPTNNVGLYYQFGSARYVYVHGEDCYVGPPNVASYGFPTFWYPKDVMENQNGGAERGAPLTDSPPNPPIPTGGATVAERAKAQLDMKSMTCTTSAMLAAFCAWDGGQLATDEVLDFVTGTPASLGSNPGCGTCNGGSAATANCGRCAPLQIAGQTLFNVQAVSDAGNDNGIPYRYPFYNGMGEGVFRIAAPGRVTTDVVRINAADEPWMDLHGNVQEIAFNMTGATFTGEFMIKYRGIGYNSSRALQNNTAMKYPEYKAAYSGGRCMRFK
jgi:hypothetical protein